jgi:hypothetical protein
MAARAPDREMEAFEAGFRLRGEFDAAIQEAVRAQLEAQGYSRAPPIDHMQKEKVPFYKTK